MNEPTIEEILEEPMPDDASEAAPPEPPQYHTLLQVWRALLAAGRGERDVYITPQWATKVVATYQQVTYQDTVAVDTMLHELVEELAQILDEVIATDDECLNRTVMEEDRTDNKPLYIQLLIEWQKAMLVHELSWTPLDPQAAVKLAALSETHQMFFGKNGLTGHLESIGFEFTEDDQQVVADALAAERDAFFEERGSE